MRQCTVEDRDRFYGIQNPDHEALYLTFFITFYCVDNPSAVIFVDEPISYTTESLIVALTICKDKPECKTEGEIDQFLETNSQASASVWYNK